MLNKILTYVCINYFDNTKNKMKKTVLITGGTGFIGRYLIKILTEKGYAINVLTRTHKKKYRDSFLLYLGYRFREYRRKSRFRR